MANQELWHRAPIHKLHSLRAYINAAIEAGNDFGYSFAPDSPYTVFTPSGDTNPPLTAIVFLGTRNAKLRDELPYENYPFRRLTIADPENKIEKILYVPPSTWTTDIKTNYRRMHSVDSFPFASNYWKRDNIRYFPVSQLFPLSTQNEEIKRNLDSGRVRKIRGVLVITPFKSGNPVSQWLHVTETSEDFFH
jgi:hypothetical protein